MRARRTARFLIAMSIAIVIVGVVQAAEAWPQWGGPTRDFTVEARELARDWGEDGPPRLWSRDLGSGFSSIVSDGRRLYTMFRDGDDEIVIALDRKTGKTQWEFRYAAPVTANEELSLEYGEGPNGSPLLLDGRVVTLGFTGKVHCLDADNGKLHWSHDLGKSYEVKIPYFGHATSPLAVDKNVVVVAGGLFAFKRDSGKLAWQNRDFDGSYGSPRLVETRGKRQVVTPVAAHLIGVDATTGKTLWVQEHKNQWGTILTSPVVDESGRVFVSAAGVGSALVDPFVEADDQRQVWKTAATQIGHSNAVLDGKWIFASAGHSASFVTATSLEDGTQAWKERGFALANLVRVGDDYLLLDFDGELALVELSGTGMEIVTRASINDAPTWTPPTLIGTTLYVRDKSKMMALDLSVKK